MPGIKNGELTLECLLRTSLEYLSSASKDASTLVVILQVAFMMRTAGSQSTCQLTEGIGYAQRRLILQR